MSATPMTAINPNDKGKVSYDAIDRTLRTMWADMAKQDGHAMQIRTLNLLAYVPANAEDDVWSTISSISVQHPGRTISIHSIDGPPNAEATIACRLGNTAQSCGEQVRLSGGGLRGEALLSLAMGLLLPGLPVVLWWHDSPDFEGRPFRLLLEVADHVLLDSRTWSDPLRTLRQLAPIRKRYMGNVRFMDLAWVALTPWRQQLAQAFDVPNMLAILPSVSAVEIDYCGKAYANAALLFTSWLMTRLGWQVGDSAIQHDGGTVVLPVTAGKQQISLTLRSTEQGDGLTAVRIMTANEPGPRLVIEEQADAGNVATRIELPPAPPIDRLNRIVRLKMADLIGAELAQNTDDRVFTATLDLAIELADKVGSLQ